MVFIEVMVVIAAVVTAVAAVIIVAVAVVAVMVVAVAVVIAVAGAVAVIIVGAVVAVGFHQHGLGEMSLYRCGRFHSLICRRRKGQLRAGLLTIHRLIILDKGAELKDSSYHITA